MAGGSPYGSQDSPGKKAKGGNSTIRPVTIKQLLNAAQVHPDSDYTIDGVDVGSIILIGTVHNRSISATNVSYEIGDGTGHIDVRQWLDSADDEVGKMEGVEQDKYVCIMGTIRTFGGKRHVSATHIRPITDHNEVYHHLLKALYVSLVLRHGGAGGGGALKPENANDYTAGAATNGASDQWASLPPIQRRIMEVVSKEESEDGMHVSAVSRKVGNAASEDVMEAIETLMNDGMLFSTIDDLHVKAV